MKCYYGFLFSPQHELKFYFIFLLCPHRNRFLFLLNDFKTYLPHIYLRRIQRRPYHRRMVTGLINFLSKLLHSGHIGPHSKLYLRLLLSIFRFCCYSFLYSPKWLCYFLFYLVKSMPKYKSRLSRVNFFLFYFLYHHIFRSCERFLHLPLILGNIFWNCCCKYLSCNSKHCCLKFLLFDLKKKSCLGLSVFSHTYFLLFKHLPYYVFPLLNSVQYLLLSLHTVNLYHKSPLHFLNVQLYLFLIIILNIFLIFIFKSSIHTLSLIYIFLSHFFKITFFFHITYILYKAFVDYCHYVLVA